MVNMSPLSIDGTIVTPDTEPDTPEPSPIVDPAPAPDPEE